ncbi:MAG TPA: phosphotransferase [Ilumatobacteraceae bacterium]|nr:phosphotransferase [Ilumatobacteraceae bacterium]
MLTDALQGLLSDHFHGPVTLAAEPARVTGGFWASIHKFSIASSTGELPAGWTGPLVLRVMPDRSRAKRESIVQRAVAASGFPAPAVLLDGYDESLGGAYMVMPFAAGKSPLSGLGPGSFLRVPRLLRRLPVQLAEVAVSLHRVDPAGVASALTEGGFPASGDGVEPRLAAIRAAAGTRSRGFDRLLDWFADHRPDQPTLVVSHGDIHPFNLLVDSDGRVTVLDWTNGDLMPREYDVGFTAGLLRCAPFSVPKLARPVFDRLTSRLADRFVSAYERSFPVDAAMLAFFEALQYARCLAEVATARSGLTNIVDDKHPFELSAAAMARRLAALTGITVILPEAMSAEARRRNHEPPA